MKNNQICLGKSTCGGCDPSCPAAGQSGVVEHKAVEDAQCKWEELFIDKYICVKVHSPFDRLLTCGNCCKYCNVTQCFGRSACGE